jgi:chromosome partitioning protein
MPAMVLLLAINKGGAAKTTTAYHVAHRAAEAKKRVLLVDLDPQGNATAMCMDQAWESKPIHTQPLRAVELYSAERSGRTPITVAPNLDLIPSRSCDTDLTEVERYPLEAADIFKARIAELSNSYDLIILDTPPTLGFLTLVPMLAGDYVVSPVQPESFDIDGLNGILRTVENLRAGGNPSIKHLGFVLSKCDERRDRRQAGVIAQIKKHVGRDMLSPFQIPLSVPMRYISTDRVPIWRNAKSGSERVAAEAVRNACDWILKGVFSGGPGRSPTKKSRGKSFLDKVFNRNREASV